MWAGFFCRQDVSISIFGRTKEFSEVRGTSLMCNFGVRSRFLDVIYGVRPPNGSPASWRDQSSLLLFHKIHCGAVSIEKDKYMTPAHSLKTTRSSHSAHYSRHQTYSDALKNFFSPRTIPHWKSLSPSVANVQSTEEFRALLV